MLQTHTRKYKALVEGRQTTDAGGISLVKPWSGTGVGNV